jgi:AraC-like DNA-binding protein
VGYDGAGQGPTAPSRRVTSTLQSSGLADIAANLVDEMLTVATSAARHGVTPRYVHKLFEDEGVTYTQFVLQHRLDRAFRMLRTRGAPHQ